MVSKQLHDTFVSITTEATSMVLANVDKSDLATGMDYASIYARSPEEFSKISEELKANGTVALLRPTGDYFKLYEPLITPMGNICFCRVRIYDKRYFERGYTDFEAKNYKSFKAKYLSRPHFSLINTGEEMVELRDPKFTVHAYFPSGNF